MLVSLKREELGKRVLTENGLITICCLDVNSIGGWVMTFWLCELSECIFDRVSG